MLTRAIAPRSPPPQGQFKDVSSATAAARTRAGALKDRLAAARAGNAARAEAIAATVVRCAALEVACADARHAAAAYGHDAEAAIAAVAEVGVRTGGVATPPAMHVACRLDTKSAKWAHVSHGGLRVGAPAVRRNGGATRGKPVRARLYTTLSRCRVRVCLTCVTSISGSWYFASTLSRRRASTQRGFRAQRRGAHCGRGGRAHDSAAGARGGRSGGREGLRAPRGKGAQGGGGCCRNWEWFPVLGCSSRT